MSDLTPSDDELVSAYLDGEATVDEIARVEADPALRGRATELQAAKELAATPVEPLRADELDRIIGAALEAGTTSDDVIDLRRASARRQQFRHRLVTAAAAVLVIAVAVPVLLAIGRAADDGDDSEDFATAEGDETAAEDAADTADGGDAGAGEELAATAAPQTTEGAEAADTAADDSGEATGDFDDSTDGDDAVDDGAQLRSPPDSILTADILVDDLGSIDEDELFDITTAAWSTYVLETPRLTTESDSIDVIDVYPCTAEILTSLPESTGAVDFSLALLDGEAVTVVVAQVDDVVAALITAPHTSCEVHQLGALG